RLPAAVAVGEPPVGDEVLDADPDREVIVLPEDREPAGDVPRLRPGDVERIDRDDSRVGCEEAADRGEERRLARAIRSDDRGEARADPRGRVVDGGEGAVALRDVVELQHQRALPVRTRRMKVSPPRNSMTTGSSV